MENLQRNRYNSQGFRVTLNQEQFTLTRDGYQDIIKEDKQTFIKYYTIDYATDGAGEIVYSKINNDCRM